MRRPNATIEKTHSHTQVGTVFIARGVGAVLGAVVSAKLYLWVRGNTVMSVVLLFLTGVLVYMPFITTITLLHISFFVLGLCTAITDTGCQIMTRKLHGTKAGPWLGANTVSFGISGALVPLIGYLTGSLFAQYIILSVVSLLVAAFLIVLPAPEKYEGLLEVRCLLQPGLYSNATLLLHSTFVVVLRNSYAALLLYKNRKWKIEIWSLWSGY